MALPIKQGENFYCQAFIDMGMKYLSKEIELQPRVWAGIGLPVIPGEFWERGLGDFAFRSLRNSFVLTATVPQPESGYPVNYDLKRKLDHLIFGLLLQGSPSYKQSFLFAGANESGKAEIRQLSPARVFFPSRGIDPLVVGQAELGRAVILADRLEIIDHQGENWRRLRRGIDALLDGSAEWRYEDSRLHQFVRCLEALILPNKGNTRRQFVHRAQTFALAKPEARQALGQIYDIRSKVEHLHNALDFFPSDMKDENKNLLFKRVRQADALSRFSLSRVLEDKTLTDVFKTDKTIDAFWKMHDHERLKLWGTRLDIETVA